MAMTKTIGYDYTLLTGQVKEVIYQADHSDELHHHYTYDTDNRLIKVEVSKNGKDKVNASQYSYYTHGPLKNTVLGDNVQQTDYTYNLQGWLKAINHPIAAFDPGKTNTAAGQDVFAEVLNYFIGDYNRAGNGLAIVGNGQNIASAVTPKPENPLWMVGSNKAKELYNGNIANVITYTAFDQVPQVGVMEKAIVGIGYNYDQLNRLLDNRTVQIDRNQLVNNESLNARNDRAALREFLSYDASGNIRSLKRYKTEQTTGNADAGDYGYKYDESLSGKKANNKLKRVLGLPGHTANDSYVYDAKGRMTRDLNQQTPLGGIQWTAYDKVKSITRNPTSALAKVNYTYDAMGNRLAKAVDVPNSTAADYTDNYVYDASGNVMAIYDGSGNLKEQYLYGVGRLGMLKPSTILRKEDLRFEITDHLGSVRAVISGARTAANTVGITYLSDYYSNGLNSREFRSSEGQPRYMFQGMEWDIETKTYNTLFRFYSPEYGRWWSPDPIVQPWQSTYSAMDGNPVFFRDPFGLRAGGGGDGGGGGSRSRSRSKTPANDKGISKNSMYNFVHK